MDAKINHQPMPMQRIRLETKPRIRPLHYRIVGYFEVEHVSGYEVISAMPCRLGVHHDTSQGMTGLVMTHLATGYKIGIRHPTIRDAIANGLNTLKISIDNGRYAAAIRNTPLLADCP